MQMSEHVVHDYGTTSLSLKAHPVSFARDQMDLLKITRAADLANMNDGDFVKVAGLVLVRQRPGTAAGICFITIEDETGSANIVVFQKLFDKYRREVTRSTFLMVEGKVQIEGKVIHVIARRCADFTGMLQKLSQAKADPEQMQTFSRADERNDVFDARYKREGSSKVVQGDLFPASRDFK
jgi:error-prone DNA polymerase